MFPGEKAGPYINRCKNLGDEFRKSGGNFPDDMFVTIILAGLSPEWRQCKSLLRTQGTLSETALCSTLLSEQKEIDLYNKRGNKKEKIAFYAQAPPDKKRLFCKYCKKTGHIIQDRWKLNGNNNNQKVAAAHQQGGAAARNQTVSPPAVASTSQAPARLTANTSDKGKSKVLTCMVRHGPPRPNSHYRFFRNWEDMFAEPPQERLEGSVEEEEENDPTYDELTVGRMQFDWEAPEWIQESPPARIAYNDEGCYYDYKNVSNLYAMCDRADGLSLFDLTSGASPSPPATADSTVRSQWATRDAAARLAVRRHLPTTERAHFSQYRSAQTLYDAVVARYSSPATAALSRLILPYLFPDLAAFPTVADLITHLRTSDTRYRAALPAEFCAQNPPPPMYITLYYIVTRLPDSLRLVRDHFLSVCPTTLTVDLLEQRLLAAETSIVAVGASRGDPRTLVFEGYSPSPLLPSVASAAAADLGGFESGDPDAPDIPTPRSYAEAIEGPYSSQWQSAMDAEMASWKSTGTYVDEVPPPGANIVSGMWIFRVKRPPGSPPVFKARYVARGFSQRQGVDYFHTFSPTPKMTTLRGSLHEEIWLRRPPGFTGSFPPGTQWSLRRPVYGLHQAPREWHDTLRTTLAGLGFAPSTADPSLFLRTDTSLPPFYILVYVDDLVFATADTAGLAHVKSELQKRHTYTDLGPSALRLHVLLASRHSSVYSPLALSSAFGWVLRYLCSTSGLGLVLGGRRPVVLTGHADASWAEDQATQRSSQGYTFSLGFGSVSWRSTRSSSVLGSSCEAEIYAGAMAAQELRWLTYLLAAQESRLQRGQLRLAYVASQANTADIFTKAFPPGDHQRFCTMLACFVLLDWSCDLLFSPTFPMG
ncbi:unnamed protein product, partial [Closterium sp. NIES-53]